MGDGCQRCEEVIERLQEQSLGSDAHCPECHVRYLKGKQWVLDPDGMPVNEVWQESDRPTQCTGCGWQGMVKETIPHERNHNKHCCPQCGAVTARR